MVVTYGGGGYTYMMVGTFFSRWIGTVIEFDAGCINEIGMVAASVH